MSRNSRTAKDLRETRAETAARAACWSEQYSEGWPAGFFNHLTGQISEADSWAELIEQEGLGKPGSEEK